MDRLAGNRLFGSFFTSLACSQTNTILPELASCPQLPSSRLDTLVLCVGPLCCPLGLSVSFPIGGLTLEESGQLRRTSEPQRQSTPQPHQTDKTVTTTTTNQQKKPEIVLTQAIHFYHRLLVAAPKLTTTPTSTTATNRH